LRSTLSEAMSLHLVRRSSRRMSRARVCGLALCCLVSCTKGVQIVSTYKSSTGADGSTTRRWPHDGVDIADDSGADVIAAASGVVTVVSRDPSGGTYVEIAHVHASPDAESQGAHYTTSYAHLSESFVRKGERVTRGLRIGLIGVFPESGNVAHVHWMLCLGECTSSSTRDPLRRTIGCFSSTKRYPAGPLQLTYPVRCR
jgi:hypothetical protein